MTEELKTLECLGLHSSVCTECGEKVNGIDDMEKLVWHIRSDELNRELVKWAKYYDDLISRFERKGTRSSLRSKVSNRIHGGVLEDGK